MISYCRHAVFSLCALLVGCGYASAGAADDETELMRRELRSEDDRLNTVYARLAGFGSDQEKRELQVAQREWLRWRDRECQSDGIRGEREAWIGAVTADRGIWNCVYSATAARATELKRELDGVIDPTYPARVNPYSRYRKWKPLLRSTGRWYFEVKVDRGKIARIGPTDVYLGFLAGEMFNGVAEPIKAVESSAGIHLYGLAIDIDAGRVYHHTDGAWQGAVPGSAAGYAVPIGGTFGAAIRARDGLTRLILENAMVANFGSEPFAYPLPVGYKAWRDTMCEEPQNSREISLCLGEELRRSDEQINDSYQILMKSLDPADRSALRDGQRAWIVHRDTECRFGSSSGDREIWYRSVLRNNEQTLCVVRITRARNGELRKMRDTAPTDQAAAAPLGARTPANDPLEFQIVPDIKRDSGRWYFEVKFQRGHIAALSPAEFTIGCGEFSTNTAGTYLLRISPQDADASPLTLGVGVDLDVGQLYVSENGAWPRGAPGSGRGVALKTGVPHVCGVHATVRLKELRERRFIEANFGSDQPFELPVPPGYRAFLGT